MDATITRGGVTVPRQYAHLVRKERDPDGHIAAIRNYIEKHPGEVITGAQFDEIIGTTTGAALVRKLIQQGRMTRKQVHNGKRGHSYCYQWHDVPLNDRHAILAAGGIVTSQLNLPELPIDPNQIPKLSAAFLKWVDEQLPSGAEIEGARAFRVYLADELKRVQEERQRILDGKNNDS